MPTKTIYVSDSDAPIFEEARDIAGETLSSIIARSLREFLARHRQQESGFEEVAVRIGSQGAEHEQRFYGTAMGDWRGFSDNRDWWLQATIYRTQKGNWAVHLTHICKASLLTDKKRWKESGDYLLDSRRSDLYVAAEPNELEGKLPAELLKMLKDLSGQPRHSSTLLDI